MGCAGRLSAFFLHISITGVLPPLLRIVCSYAFLSVFQNIVASYTKAFSWIFPILVFLGRYLWKKRKINY